MVTAPSSRSGAGKYAIYTYNAKFTPYDVAGNWAQYRQKAINDELLYLFGYGDGGGGPTAEMQETAARLADLPGFPTWSRVAPKSSFAARRARVERPRSAAWVGELYLEYHRGTYTSQGWIKRANRQAENCSARPSSGRPRRRCSDPATADKRAELNEGWELLLFNQFHDILPGSSYRQVYADARADFHAINGGQVRARCCARQLSEAVGTDGPSSPSSTRRRSSGATRSRCCFPTTRSSCRGASAWSGGRGWHQGPRRAAAPALGYALVRGRRPTER